MTNKRNSRGFTMMEMLIAVAILVILMGLGFIAVQNYQRSMKQLELDKTAREIFVAAQNHLTVAESQGFLEKRKAADKVGDSHVRDGETYHYYFVTPRDSRLNEAGVLQDMLPMFSIDDKVRQGGSYVIEYSLASATVTNVFYSDQSRLSEYTFNNNDWESLFVDPGYLNDDKAKSRLDGYGDNKAVIGWYGGENAKTLTRTKLYAPKVQIINAERLEVKVSFTRTAIKRMAEQGIDAQLKVIVQGETSKKQININNEEGKRSISYFDADPFTKSEVIGTTAYRSHVYVLDDITQRGKHFKDICCAGTDPLIPGENIKVSVSVQSTSVLSNVPTRSAGPTNSLFGDSSSIGDALGSDGVADIANFRHLENLDPKISGYDLEAIRSAGDGPATKAVQSRSLAKNSDSEDLSWQGFLKKTGGTYIYNAAGQPSKNGSYVPVNPEYEKGANTVHYLTSYDGKGLSIEGVKIDDSTNAGLFGSLYDCDIKNVELVNFDIRTSNGSAGALAGSGSGLTVTNVLAHNTLADDSGLMIKGSNATGGLVGQASKSTIAESAAAVYVESSSSSAGGLVGKITGESSVNASYAGGHTSDGKYLSVKTGDKRVNVQGATNSGGLVGEATFDAGGAGDKYGIYNSYATTSVSGGNNVGGLVGSVAGGSIEKSYCTGLVVAREGATDPKLGAFAGAVSGVTLKNKDCKFFSIINEGMSAVPGTTDLGVDAFDKTAKTYQAFFKGTEPAKPYDKTLADYYQNKYAFQTVKRLGGENVTGFVKTHYGDWPAPEVLVRNEKATS